MQSVGDYQYRPGELIGHGAFALVYKGEHKQTGIPVAIKQILLKNIPKPFSIRQEEISILKELRHPNIVQFYYYHETSAEIYLVMEYCNGNDLADYLQKKKTLSEISIRHLTRHIAEALQVIHQKHIIHRDIKPQNLLLSFPSSTKSSASKHNFREAIIKLADFGFARYLSGTDMAATLCGSPLYMAPEILLGNRYDYKVDLWSAGTILFQCLTGSAPFDAMNPHALRRRYVKETLVPKIPNGTSDVLADLLLKLIKKKPQERLTYQGLISHPFLQTGLSRKGSIQDYSLPQPLHAKSSPVPIHRHQTTDSGYTLTSPNSSPNTQVKQDSFGTSSNKYFSPSSGPPSLHKIGSNSSITHYYASPPTKDIDEDFVLVASKTGGSNEGSSGHTPSSHGSSRNLYGPLHDPRHSKQTPPTVLSPVVSTQDTPPFSSLFKLMGRVQSSNAHTHFQASNQTTPLSVPSSTGSSPASTKLSSADSPGNSRRSLQISQPGSRGGSVGIKLSILQEMAAPQLVDSTELVSQSLLMNSEVLQMRLDKLMENQIQSSPENLFEQLQKHEADTKLIETQSHQQQQQVELTELGGNMSPVDTSEELFSFQLEEEVNDKCLVALKQSTFLAQELLKLAKSRQGPMLLLSSSMGDSGGMLDHAQRFSEQLMLCVKAANVIETGCREYELSLAANSVEPQNFHTIAFDEAQQVHKDCLEKARLARELYSKCYNKRKAPLQMKMTAEQLIFMQAVDMCKQAILDEEVHRNESVKRYHLSKILLQLLLSDARTERDRVTIKKYLARIQSRLKVLLNLPTLPSLN